MFLKPQNILTAIDLKQGMTVADYGCGRGDFALEAAKAVGDEGLVYAIDILDKELSVVKSRAQAENITNIKTVRANLEVDNSSQIPNESLDIIFLVNVLFQSKLHKEFIKETHRALKPQGKLVIADWKVFKAKFGPQPGQEVNPENITRICQEEGFSFLQDINVGEYHWCKVYIKK